MNKLQSVNDARNNTTTRRGQNSRTGYVFPPLPILPRISGLRAIPLHHDSIRPGTIRRDEVVAIIEHALDVISEDEVYVGDDNDDDYYCQR